MNKFGIIACGYNCSKVLYKVLEPWFKLKDQLNIKIAAVQGQFKEYYDLGYEDNDIDTKLSLEFWKNWGSVDYLYIQNPEKEGYQNEAEIRNKGLKYLLQQNVDYVYLLDLVDEYYTEQNIINIFNFINENPETVYFRTRFKNYIIDDKHWVDNFNPVRCFKVFVSDKYKLNRFYWDNDIFYIYGKENELNWTPQEISYNSFVSLEIPKNIAFIKHLTWQKENSKDKINYHMKHFGECSYKWDEEKQEVKINYDYYKKYNKEVPVIYED